MEFPKYDIEYEVESEDMGKALSDMGVYKLFSEPEWIEGIGGTNVGIFQKARFIVSKEGVEGAAATAIIAYIAPGADKIEPIELIFNRPFMYILVKDNVPLFIGSVYNPVE